MPRPIKCRKVCHLPPSRCFKPTCGTDTQEVVLSVDEYEAVRLIDHEGFTQEECGRYMRVARTTVQEIYTDARRKIAKALVEARPLEISGGRYELCDGKEAFCRCGGCKKHRQCREKNNEEKVL